MEKPLVSVIMPAYNAEKYIGEAIESILHQTYENWELIIVEDCSVDGTRAVIEQYRDDRIKVIYNDSNKGIAETTNHGVDVANGKYIALLDDDDVAELDRLEVQIDYLEKHPEIDILGGRTTFVNEDGSLIDYGNIPRNNPKYIKAILLFNCMDFMNSTAMIRKDFIDKNGLRYKDNCMGMQDFLFYIEGSKLGNISTINSFLLKHRIHGKNETKRQMEINAMERARVYADFQKYSLEKSGFKLDTNEMNLINKVLAEKNGKCDSIVEVQELYGVFNKLLSQARKMQINYYEELEHLLKSKLAKQIIKLDIFDEK